MFTDVSSAAASHSALIHVRMWSTAVHLAKMLFTCTSGYEFRLYSTKGSSYFCLIIYNTKPKTCFQTFCRYQRILNIQNIQYIT